MFNITLNELKNITLNCQKCNLASTRTNVVFGIGNPNSKILLVGEGPGQNEDMTGIPFVGRGGKLLDKMLEEIGLSREKNVYIANMVKCRPPNNRDPLPEEIKCCIDYLRCQFKIIKPKIIVCVGRIAANNIIKNNFRVTQEHGVWFTKKNVEIMGTFHPAALLRNPNNLPLAQDDFKKLKEKIEAITPEVFA